MSAKQSNFAARYAITRLLTLHIEGIVYALVPDALNSCPRAIREFIDLLGLRAKLDHLSCVALVFAIYKLRFKGLQQKHVLINGDI